MLIPIFFPERVTTMPKAATATPPPLKGFVMEWPPPPRPDACHIYIADRTREKVVEVSGEPHLLIPIIKQYTDPLGLRDLITPEPRIDPPCPLCCSIIVSGWLHNSSVSCTKFILRVKLTLPLLSLTVLRRFGLSCTPSLLQKRGEEKIGEVGEEEKKINSNEHCEQSVVVV